MSRLAWSSAILALMSTLPETQALLAFPEFQSSLPAEPLFAVDAAVTDQSPLQIIFTSGTTSEPKGIVHTHRNVLASVGPIEREMQKYLQVRALGPSPALPA